MGVGSGGRGEWAGSGEGVGSCLGAGDGSVLVGGGGSLLGVGDGSIDGDGSALGLASEWLAGAIKNVFRTGPGPPAIAITTNTTAANAPVRAAVERHRDGVMGRA